MTFEFNGTKYQKASAHQREWGTGVIAELELAGDESVLDLGCGDGTLTGRLAELLPEGSVLGIDASQGMIEVARARERDNLHFRRLDINELDFVNRFDLVFSNAALHWVKDHGRLLANLRRALRQGGRLRFNFAAAGNCAHFFAVVREVMGREAFRPLFADFEWPWYMPTVDEYRALVEASGLGEVKLWEENADRFFPDAEALIRWVDQPSIVPFLAHLPEGAKRPFRDAVVQAMVERTRQADGRCFETFRRLNLSAV